MPWILFWMQSPWDENITVEDWGQYLDALSWEFILWVVVFVLLICAIYFFSVRRLVFADLQRPFRPMRWLWLSLVPGIIVGVRAALLFDSFDGLSGKFGAIPSGISTGLMAVFLTLVFAWLSFLVKGVTPEMFEARPYGLINWIRRKFKGKN